MSSVRAVAVILVLTSLSGCAARSPGVASAGDAIRNEGEVNWDNPIGGQPVNSVADVRAMVGFPVTAPTPLGAASAIYVIPASEGDGGAVDFIFDLPMGRVVVAEFPYDFPVSHWDEFVGSIVEVSERGEATPSPSIGPDGEEEVIQGSAETYTLPDGRTALITTSEDGTQSDIRWLSAAGVEIVVQGPDLSKASAILLANRLADKV